MLRSTRRCSRGWRDCRIDSRSRRRNSWRRRRHHRRPDRRSEHSSPRSGSSSTNDRSVISCRTVDAHLNGLPSSYHHHHWYLCECDCDADQTNFVLHQLKTSSTFPPLARSVAQPPRHDGGGLAVQIVQSLLKVSLPLPRTADTSASLTSCDHCVHISSSGFRVHMSMPLRPSLAEKSASTAMRIDSLS